MANPVGKVVVLEGQAFVRGKDGIDRILKQGDVVHEGDVIITSPGSQVGIDFTGGQPSLMIGGNETVTLDNAVSGQNLPEPADAALSANVGDTAAIAQAIVSGNSLDELLEETAAGVDGGGAESGHSFVRLLRIAEDVSPLSLDYGTGSADQTAGSLAGVEFTNGMPVAVPDQVVTDEDTSVMVDVRANDSDPENDPLTVVSVSNGAHGTVVIDPASGNPVYSPDPNWHGEDTFSYTISDGRGGTSSASVTVTVNPVNDAPVPGTISVNPDGSTTADPNSTGSGNYAHTIPEDTSVSGQVRATDVDGDTLAYSLATGPQHGSVTVEADGSYTYTPDADYNGNDAFTVLVDDGQGGTAISTVDIVITPVDDASTISVGQGSVTEDVVLSTSGRLNIADPDGPQDERFVAQTSVSGAHGTFSLGEDGSWTYNLNNSDPAVQALDPGQTLTEVFPVSGVDGTPSTVTITINGTAEYVPPPPPANSIPDAVDDLVTTDPDMPVNINVLGNDSDPDGDALAVTNYGQGSNGTVSQSGSELVYTPNAGFVGTDTFTYTISDGRGGTDTATVTINVGLANDPPIAVDDTASTPEDTPITLPAADLLANDSDPDGDPLSISAVGPATHGTVVLNADGSVTFTPEANYNGQASFVYTISDGNGGTDTATVTLTIPGTNDAPIAVNDGPLSTDEDVPLTGINVLGNDSDPDGDPLTVSAASSPNGSVVINPDGTLDFTPTANFSGPTTITYTIDDGNGGTDTATVTINVGLANDPPIAVDDTASTPEDTPITLPAADLLANDSDPDGDPLSISAVGPATHGTVVLNADGSVTFTPEANYNGQASFVYTISDGNGGTDTATVTLTIPGTNDAPIAVNDGPLSTDEDVPLTGINVLGNDSDPDGDPLTVSAASSPNGSVVINPDGTLDFTPTANFSGPTTITYTIDDGNGGTDTATVTINVGLANDPPVAVNDGPLSTDEDVPLTGINVLGNDSDPDGDPLTVSAASSPNGSVVINPDGTLDFTPATNFSGPTTITYTIDDGNGGTDTATVTINVGLANDPPVAVDDSASTPEDTPITLPAADLLANDSDPDGDPLSISAVGPATHGTVVLNADGSVTFTPEANYSGQASFVYTISDGNGGTDTATVTLTIPGTNDAPIAVNDGPLSTDEDVPLTGINVLGNDSDPDGDPLTVTAASSPNGSVVINPDGTLDFTPATNFSGPTTITYTIDDGNGGTDTATVTINVGLANDPPVAVNDGPLSTDEDVPLTGINVLGNDSDPDGDPLTVSAASSPNGSVVINPDGTLDFTPATNFSGPTTITYTIDDGNGGTDTATVTINVGLANDAPIAVNDGPLSTDEDVPLTGINVLGNDSDPDGDPLTVSAASSPNGSVVINPDGTLDFTPATNFSGPTTITYTIDDGNGGTDTATVTINVGLANDPPVAVDDTASTPEDTPITLPAADLLANDSDPDGDPLSISAVGPATHGTVVLNADGSVTFTPEANYSGQASFVYTISDGNGGSDTATVTLTIPGTNDAPIAVNDGPLSTDEDVPLTGINVLGNDSDPDGDPLTVSAASSPNGSVVINPDGTLDFTPAANFSGPTTITYTIDDGNGGTDTATVTINVGSANDAPIAVNDGPLSTDEDVPLTGINVLGNDSDPDGDPLTVSAASSPNGSVVINPDGTLDFTPTANFSGPTTITYTIDDGNGGTDTATVTINVGLANDPPVAVDDTASTPEDTPITLPAADLLANDSDPDGDPLSISAVGPATHGTVVLNADGSATFTPEANYNGQASFVYTISDGNGGSDTATVTLTIPGTNDAPIAVNDGPLSTDEDVPLTGINVLGNDSDPDGDPLTVSAASSPNGSVVINPDGTLDFTPAANFSGPTTITYTIDDGNGGTDTATVTINVGSANDAPIAVDDTASTPEDTPITLPAADLLANDSDPDGDPLSISAVGPATHGTVVLNADGSVTFTPEANYNGQASFVYTISDGNGGTDTATVTLTIPGTNDAPITVNDGPLSTDEDVPLTGINVLGNDSDPDGDPLTVSAASSPNGSVVINPDGTLDFTPATNFSGPTTITYTIDDGNGGTTDATVTVDVTPVADMPLLSVESHVADTLISTSWESNANNDNSSTVNAVGSFEGWTLLTTPEIQSGGQNSFEIWSSGDSQENAATNMVTVYAAPGNGDDFLELNDAGVATDGTVMPQTLGIAKTITTQDGMVYQLSFDYAGRPGFSTAYTSIAIQIDGTTVATYANTSPSTAIDWKNLKLAFEGDGAAHTISIIGTPTTTHRNGRGSFIDDIVLTEQQGVVAANANGGASTDIRLASYITAALADTDGSETLTLTLSGLPSGAQVISGSEVHSAAGGSITLSGDELADAMLRIDGSFRGDLSVDVVATATETANGDAASTPAQTLDLTILAPAGSLQAVDIADSTSSVITGTSSADTLTGTTSANTIYGLAGNDTIDGRGGNDIISGGTGNDTLTGGSGADVFKWSLGDAGTAGAPAVDRIVDGAAFNSTSGEALDLRDLLQGEVHGASDTGNLSSYLHFTYDSASNQTTIEVSSHGSGSAGPDQLIVLSGVNLVGSSTSDEAIIQDLLTRGKLITD